MHSTRTEECVTYSNFGVYERSSIIRSSVHIVHADNENKSYVSYDKPRSINLTCYDILTIPEVIPGTATGYNMSRFNLISNAMICHYICYDILTIPEVIPGTATGYNMSRINLTPGVRYYSNVIAYNYAGAHTTSTSDGFIVDHVDPSSGIVYDGLGILDKEYQNSTHFVAAHWHGFIDTESGILSYHWCVGKTTHVHRIYAKTECSVLPWNNVGLHTSASKNLSTQILQGIKIYSKVYAIDSVGRPSSIVVSDGVIIDVTPPIPEKTIHGSENLGNNTSFENTGGDDIKFVNVSSTDICTASDIYHPLSWIPSDITCTAVVSSDVNLAKHGRSYLLIRGSLYQQLEQEVNFTTDTTSGHVLGHVVYLHAWSSIHGSWSFTDPESPIVDYTWAIGYAEGGTQIQPFRSAGLMNFAFNNKVTLVHNTYIYVTAIATNAAGLRGVSYSDPILVDLTPPDIKYVNDGAGPDELAWELNEVIANWAVGDPESGILICQWAIGYHSGGSDLLPYTEVTSTTAYKVFPYSVLIGYTIYTTLKCENKAGLSSVMSSNGVKISNLPPSATSAVVQTLPLSLKEYSPRDLYLGVNDNIRLKWTGFDDHIGVERYKVFYKRDGTSELMFFPDVQDVLYAHFTKMSLTEGSHNFSVQAINKLFKRSNKATSYSITDMSSPVVDAANTLTINWINKQIVVSWDSIFTSDNAIFYEVSSGSTLGGINIIQWQETNQTSITFGIPAFVAVITGLPVYVTVTAISVGGYSSVKTGHFTLP
ncbi:unnamed protein product [Mytilus edulis]|uniref:Fibronectin type-III domain-containing protein n=1 Tax=Mytilus edulis TaxID=6550 RepID=A0A8S3TI43_MYTED|nr:unnamed protein product [Mytilus edulis]